MGIYEQNVPIKIVCFAMDSHFTLLMALERITDTQHEENTAGGEHGDPVSRL